MDERVSNLQQEISLLDKQLTASTQYTTYFFIGAIVVPFVVFAIIYNTKYANDNGTKDRKKALKLTLIITAVMWIILYLTNWWLYKR